MWVPGRGGQKAGGQHPAGPKEDPPSWPHLGTASARRTGYEGTQLVHSPPWFIEHSERTWPT